MTSLYWGPGGLAIGWDMVEPSASRSFYIGNTYFCATNKTALRMTCSQSVPSKVRTVLSKSDLGNGLQIEPSVDLSYRLPRRGHSLKRRSVLKYRLGSSDSKEETYSGILPRFPFLI